MPVPSKIRGTVRVIPEAVTSGPFTLDMRGRHRWWPISPRCRVEVALTSPDLSWNGTGYFDTNTGDEALEDAFTTWDWCRGNTDRGAMTTLNRRRCVQLQHPHAPGRLDLTFVRLVLTRRRRRPDQERKGRASRPGHLHRDTVRRKQGERFDAEELKKIMALARREVIRALTG